MTTLKGHGSHMNTKLQQPPVQKAPSLSDMPVGAILEFWYRGNGDHPEQYRHVQVTEVRDNGILAEDTEYGGTKMFLNSQASDIDLVDDVAGVTIAADDIPDTSQADWTRYVQGRDTQPSVTNSDFDIRTVNFVDARNRKKILIKILKLQKQKRQFDKKYLEEFSFGKFKNRLNKILSEIIK